MSSLKFYSECKKVSVTSVSFFGHNLLAGVGGDVYVFETDGNKKVQKHNIFESSVIHGIVKNTKLSKVCVFGGKQISIVDVDILNNRLSVVCKWREDDWVLCCQWVSAEGQLAVLTAHNVLTLRSLKGVRLSTVHCAEKCILYSAFVLPNANRWEDVVAMVGTVFQQIVIWVVADDSSGDRAVLHRLCGHKGVIFSVTYSAQLRLIGSTSDDRSVRVWSVDSPSVEDLSADDWKAATISLKVTIFGHTARVWQSWLLTDERILSTGEDSMLGLWTSDGKSISQRETHQGGGAWCVAVSDDERLVVTGGADGGVTLWPLEPPVTTSTALPRPTDTPRRIALLPRGLVVTVTEGGRVMLCMNRSWSCVFHDQRIASYCLLEVSPSRNSIGLATIDGHVIVLSSYDFKIVVDQEVSSSKIYSMHWLDETTILTCLELGKIMVWSVNKSELEEAGRCHLPVCKERWTTAAVKLRNTIVYGDRAGNLHSSPVLPTHANNVQEEVCTLRRAHSRLGVSSLCTVGDEVWSTGRDGMLRRFCVNNADHSLVPGSASKLPLDWAATVLHASPGSSVALCFHESKVVLWDVECRRKLLSLQCGGGHRSWDCLLSDGQFTFVFLKDKTAHLVQSQLVSIPHPMLLEGFHTREINSMTHIAKGLVASGGEDGTVRLSQYSTGEWTTCTVEHNHLSSIRAVTAATMNQQMYLFSAGGRAQIKVWEVSLDKQARLTEITSLMLREERKGRHWLNVVPISDPETRYMDLAVLPESDTSVHILAACSDAYLRVFHFDMTNSELCLVKSVKNSCYCMLRVGWYHCGLGTVVVSSATDGHITFWRWPDCFVISEDTVHQSGVNGLSVSCVADGRVLVASGGDDNSLALTLYSAAGARVDQWFSSSLHSSVVTGVTIVGDKLVCCGGDQRVTLLSWSVSEDKLTVQLLAQHCCSVPDLKGLVLLDSERKNITLSVYGDGMEVLKIEP